MSNYEEWCRYTSQFPDELRELIHNHNVIKAVTQMCFNAKVSKEDLLINLVLFIHYENECNKDMLIDRSQRMTQPAMYRSDKS